MSANNQAIEINNHVFFHNLAGRVMYGMVTGTERLGDMTITAQITLKDGTTITLPTSTISIYDIPNEVVALEI
ncbi:MAG: hypothetical protein ACREHG_11210 [Candidatus Saccharimonadales bacterium]